MNKKIEQRFLDIEKKLFEISQIVDKKDLGHFMYRFFDGFYEKDVRERTAMLKTDINLLMNYFKLEKKTYTERTVLEKKEDKK